MRPRLLGQLAFATALALTPDKRDEIFVSYVSISAGLICLAGLMSGLTLGLLSLDTLDLEVFLLLCKARSCMHTNVHLILFGQVPGACVPSTTLICRFYAAVAVSERRGMRNALNLWVADL